MVQTEPEQLLQSLHNCQDIVTLKNSESAAEYTVYGILPPPHRDWASPPTKSCSATRS
jgi:hypothetical protein